MTPAHFAFLARLLHRRAGIVLTDGKLALTERRLAPVARRFGFRDSADLIQDLQRGHEALATAVIDAMTVNETSFYRDPALFRRLRDDILPSLLAARAPSRRLRIWSAACAAGQEAYSIAMILDGLGLAAQGWTIDLIATDLSGDAIARAVRGQYSFFEVQRGLSPGDLAAWFDREEKGYRVCSRLRRMVTFRPFNLLDSFGWLDDLDLVFCRNVLMYFDAATRRSVLARLGDCLSPQGLLVLGETETPQAAAGLFQAMPGAAGFYSQAHPARAVNALAS